VEAALAARCDLHESLPVQFLGALAAWLRLQVDDCTGISLVDATPVLARVQAALLPTLILAAAALLLALLVGFAGGVAAAQARGVAERGVRGAIAVVTALPGFVLAPVFVLVGALWLGLFAPGRFLSPPMWVAPALAVGLSLAAGVARVVRDALTSPAAALRRKSDRARGLANHVVHRRALRLALLPVASGLAPVVSAVVMGGIAVELVFDLPGLGPLVLAAADQRDYNTLLAGALAYAVILMCGTALADLLYGALDPRVRERAVRR
jgi:ABC-type dipeptide/oligopeptide/nickel transport system permease component